MKDVALAEVADVNPRSEAIPGDTEVSFVGMAELDATTARTTAGRTRRFAEVSKGYTVFRDRDILIAKITPCFENCKIGQAQLGSKIGVGSTEFHVVRPHDGVLDRYLLHYLRQDWVRVQGESRMTGSVGQRRVPADYIEALRLPLPPLDEQRRIAAILDQADGLCAKRRKSLHVLESLPAAIFVEMFGDPVENPLDWRRVPVSQVVSTIVSGESPKCEARAAQNGEWAVLKLSAVSYGSFDHRQNKAFLGDVQSIRRVEVGPGDFLFSRKNTKDLVGASTVVYDAPPRLLLPDLIFKLELIGNEVEAEYLHGLLTNERKRPQVVALASGSASSMSNISQARLRSLLVEVPPIALQRQYAARIRHINTMRDRQRDALIQLESVFRSLQYRGFSGQL